MSTTYRLINTDRLTSGMIHAGVEDKRALAAKTGISYSTATHLNVTKVSFATALKIAEAVHMDMDDLFRLAKK